MSKNQIYKVTRKEIVDAAMSLLGVPFRHQGRDPETGIDCVGLLVVIGRMINFPKVWDVEAYRRVPSADTIRQTLLLNCDEIPVAEVQAGDIYLMRIGGIKPRHTAVKINDDFDLAKGIEPKLIHAAGLGVTGQVTIEPVAQWIQNCVSGFRIKGLVTD